MERQKIKAVLEQKEEILQLIETMTSTQLKCAIALIRQWLTEEDS